MQSYVQYILWLYDRDAIISYMCVCILYARKLDYKGHSRLWTNEHFVQCRCDNAMWLVYHDNEGDDWMNRFALMMFPFCFFRRIFRKSRESSTENRKQFDRQSFRSKIVIIVDIRAFDAANCLCIAKLYTCKRGKWIRKIYIRRSKWIRKVYIYCALPISSWDCNQF